MQRQLPIGMSDLEKIRSQNMCYVDKTKFIAMLAKSGGYYFLSRPRRFGKSLFIDTLKQAFLGNKDLFKGLYLEANWDWEVKYPVIHISFGSNMVFQEKDDLLNTLQNILQKNAEDHGVELRGSGYSGMLSFLISDVFLKYKQRVVILVDEYDKPILDVIADLETSKIVRDILRSLYSVIKDNDQYLHFVFLTGVSKFSKVSLFSGLNNLRDITLARDYADICGYTQAELESGFADYLVDVDKDKLRTWYNGYNFAGSEEQKVYNPFDILLFFSNHNQYQNYWFETATPTFLIKILQQNRYYFPNLEHITAMEDSLSSFDIETIPLTALLFQTGYLTIKEQIKFGMMQGYILSYPNLEVKASLNNKLAELGTTLEHKTQNLAQMFMCLRDGNIAGLRDVITGFFSSIPYNWYVNNNIAEYEGFYCSIVYSYLCALGYTVVAEDATNLGRIDLTLQMEDKILIMEFKLSTQGNAESALQQITDKDYAGKYKIYNKPIYLIGISFDPAQRNVSDFKWLQI